MLFFLSPAKTLDEVTPAPIAINREPHLLEESKKLLNIAQKLSVADLQKLMKISPNLAEININRFQSFQFPFTKSNAKPAVYLFKGEVYTGLDAYHLSPSCIEYLDHHLMILSGLYGALRPLDLIQPYRLEMGITLTNECGSNLYSFWNSSLHQYLNEVIDKASFKMMINLASKEYSQVIDAKKIAIPIITPIFKDKDKHGDYKVISFLAKKARGMMMKYAAETQSTTLNDLKKFKANGYRFHQTENDYELLFHRD